MYPARQQPRPKFSLATLFMIIVTVSVVLWIFYFQVRDVYINRENISSRCFSELANVKYQLDNVLEYKKKMDTVIADMQQESTILKQSVKEFSSSYLLMKQQLEICEVQTEDLEVECKVLKSKLQQAEAEIATCKKAPG